MPLDSQTDYVVWRAPGAPVVRIRGRAVEGIHHEVMEAMAAVPRRGAETGGILLGRRDGAAVVIEDFEPVPTEHRFGPSYRLSVADQRFLQETLQWFRSGKQPGLSVVGFYRTHTRPDFALTEEDHGLAGAHFADSGDLFLLIKPSRTQGTVADFFLWRQGKMAEAAKPVPFPFEDMGLQAEEVEVRPAEQPEFRPAEEAEFRVAVPVEPEPDDQPTVPPPVEPKADDQPTIPPPVEAEPLFAAASAADAMIQPEPPVQAEPRKPPMMEWPALPPHRGSHATVEPEPPRERKPNRQWLWTAAAVVLAAIGAGLGYLSVRPDTATGPAAPASSAERGTAPDVHPAPVAGTPAGAANPKPSPLAEGAERPVSAAVKPEEQESSDIRAFLDHWAEAVQKGDVEAAAACYAPRVSPYFTRASITRDGVRQSIRRSISRYGKLAINRLSDVSIQRAGDSKAVVTLRKHWQTAGYDKFAGEEQERLTLVREGGAWHIASEREQKVYWTHRARRRPR